MSTAKNAFAVRYRDDATSHPAVLCSTRGNAG
jgi:hypothetical protein